MGFRKLIIVTAALLGLTSQVASAQQAKQLFGAAQSGSEQKAQSFGSYAKGCAAGLVELPETGKTWQAMRLSRNRNWGHPQLIDFAQDLSRKAARKGWAGLYFGDFSQPRGGPMLSGHRSHQVGLDADVWLYPATKMNLSRSQRENISAISMRRAKGAFVNSKWTRTHHEVVKAAAKDSRVARIFIFPGAKVQMCKDEKGDRAWLRKIRPWYGHHYHFHVRLKCQRGSANCENQSAPPAGDGCADAQKWVNDILDPPPPPKNPAPAPARQRRELVLADLPRQCSGVLQSN